MKKECFRCNKIKQLSEFYEHKKMADGHLNKCKECTRRDSRENRKTVSRTQEGVERLRKYSKEWVERNLIKRSAHVIVGNAIRDKRLKKGDCEVCGLKKTQAHHDDYNFPMQVRWFCIKHHAEHHSENRKRK